MALKELLDTARRRFRLPLFSTEQVPVPHQHIRLSNPWHAVSIQPGKEQCKAVVARLGERYLSKDAPSLPLPGCSASNCTCRYAHFEDRRYQGTQRDSQGRPMPNPGRRNTD